MFKIIIVILIMIVLICTINYFNLFNIENFISGRNAKSNTNTNPTSSTSLINGTKTNNNRIANNIQNNVNIPNYRNRVNIPNYKNSLTQQILNIDDKVLFNNKDYNENLSVDNKENKYYYDDMIDQTNINETAFNVVYSIDPIDYANVKTGIQKCNEDCKGVCFENGYDGIATCYPKESKDFDWGTLYKNPTFTYGYNAYGPNNLKQ